MLAKFTVFAALGAVVSAALPFEGQGYIIPQGNESGIKTGCLNADGLWTTNQAKCAVYLGVRTTKEDPGTSNPGTFLSTSSGNCITTGGGVFSCEASNPHTAHNVWNLGKGDVLWTGDLQSAYATKGANPPTGDQLSELHLWGSTDSGEFHNLGWQAL